MKHESGFTLIEMLVVVAIIGLLASVVITGLGSARQKARDVRRISDIRQIQNALETHYSDNVSYPADLSGLSVPEDPLSGVYEYFALSSGSQMYFLGTCLENDRPQGIVSTFNNNALAPSNAGLSCDCSDIDSYCVIEP